MALVKCRFCNEYFRGHPSRRVCIRKPCIAEFHLEQNFSGVIIQKLDDKTIKIRNCLRCGLPVPDLWVCPPCQKINNRLADMEGITGFTPDLGGEL